MRYVADFRDFLKEGTVPERKALIRNFVEGIEVVGDEATLTYTVPMPSDGAMSESTSVLDFVKSGPPHWTKSRTFTLKFSLIAPSSGPSVHRHGPGLLQWRGADAPAVARGSLGVRMNEGAGLRPAPNRHDTV